jgi:type 1 glutamine amidotransferase
MIRTIYFLALFAFSSFAFSRSEAQSISSFTLLNAATDTEIGTLADGDIINLAEINGSPVNVRANTSPTTVGSVVFTLQGVSFRTENAAPYALVGNSGNDYYAWSPSPGSYELQATPFPQSKGQGTAGSALTVTFTVVDQPIASTPAAPSSLEATVTTPGTAVLSWTDNSSTETAFEIETSDPYSSAGWEPLTTVAANTTSYSDNTLGLEGYRDYRIRAVNAAGASAFTAPLEVANLPYPPTDFVITNVTESSFDLSWTPSPFGNDYLIEYAFQEAGPFDGFDALYYGYDEFSYSGLLSDTTYFFRMRVNFEANPSAWNTFSVTTLPSPDVELPAVVRINAGGNQVSFGDSVFAADAYFTGNGKTYANNKITNVANTTQDELYRTERSTNQNLQSFGYDVPLTNGEYVVKLHFAEIYFGATGGGTGGSNKRVFSATLEEEPIITNLDLNAEVGPMTATVKTFTTQVSDQVLNLNFSASVNQPKVSAIEIFGEGSLITEPPVCAWNSLASSSLSKVEAQSAKVNGKLYVLAGFMAGLKITGATEIYDPAADQWSTGAPMPLPVTHMGAAVAGNDIWIVAGFVGNHPGVATDAVQVYNTVTDTWREGPPLPNPRGSGAAVYSNGKLHFFGGLLPDRRTDVGEHYILDLANLAAGWQAAAPMPNPRNHLSGAAVDGLIYAIGGQYGHDAGVQDQKFLDAYDPATDTWTRKADLPSARSHFEPGTMVHNKKIIIAGGRRGGFFFDDVTEYDPATDEWTERCELPENLLAPAAKVFGDRLIVANGGENGTCCPLNKTRWIAIEPEAEEEINVLVYHETNGFRHGSINAGIAMIEELGTNEGWTTTATADSELFAPATLSQYDVVVWLNTSGDGLLTAAQQTAFEAYIRGGGGFVGVHAATDTYRDGSWPWYNELVGGIVQTSPNHTANNTNATMDVVNSHPAVAHLGDTWNKDEEYYYWERNGGFLFAGNINLLQVRSTGSNSYDAPRPVTWYKEYDGGRSFYTALGHNASDYQSNGNFRTMMQEAILWAAGTTDASFARTANVVDKPAVSEADSPVAAYPNPVREHLTLSLPDAAIDHSYAIELVSLDGNRRTTHTVTQPRATIPVDELPQGVYVLMIRGPHSTHKQLVIVSN